MRGGGGVRAFNARRRPLVLPCQTLITGNKLENRDCHNPENESGVSSERRCRLSRSRPRYLVTLMPTASAAPSWESTKAAGRVLYLELACLRIIDFLLIGYLRPLPPPFLRPPLRCTPRPLLPIIIQLGSAGPCSRTGSNGRAALRVPHATSFDDLPARTRWRGTNVKPVETSGCVSALSIACPGVTVQVANSAWAYIGDEWYPQMRWRKRGEKSANGSEWCFLRRFR